MPKTSRSKSAPKIPANAGTTHQLAPSPAPASDRPTRKAKQVALEQKVWTSDLPATRKRALSSPTDKAQSGKPKKVKHALTMSSKDGGESTGSALNKDSDVNVPPRFARKTVLLARDFDSSGEDDIPLSAAGARSAPKAPAALLTEKTTHVEGINDSGDEAANSEEDISDEDDDFEGREQALAEQSESDDEVLASMEARGDTDALGARLTAEASAQPMWSQPKQKEKALPRRVASDDEKVDKEPGTGTSQSQQKAKSNRAGEKKAARLSKTELRAQQERPVFKTPAFPASNVHSMTSNSVFAAPAPLSAIPLPLPAAPAPLMPAPAAVQDDSSDSDSDVELVDAIRPIDYQIVFPAQGGPLSLKAQHPDIQDAIQATITRLERKLVLEDAFPDAHKRGRGVRMTMVETVRELEPKDKFRSLLTRFITDAPFLKSLASIPNQRISTFRGKIKDRSNTSVSSFFGLVPGQAAKDRVDWLLPHLTYVYPLDFEKRQVSDNLPYRAPIVINVLRESFFKGTKSFYGRNEDIFTSSLPGRNEREIPLVMLALVGAAIHASLMDWRSGDCSDTSHFSIDRCLDAYTEHKILLNEIKKSAPVKYHTMMYKLFDEASGIPVHAMPLGASAIAHLNLDAMEED